MSQSKRDRQLANNAAHRHYGLIYDKPPMITETVKPPRQQRAPRPDAPPLEREVLKAVWHYLSVHPKVAWVTRINAGGTSFTDGHGGQQFVRFNYKKGISDLIGQMRNGLFLAVECKREGEPLQDHQRAFLNEVRAAGGVAFVARSVTDAEDALA